MQLVRKSLAKSKQKLIQLINRMERLKSFRNYLNQATNGNSGGVTSFSNPLAQTVEEPVVASDETSPSRPMSANINARLHKSLNDSTKRISTLLQFRSTSAKSSQQQQQAKGSNTRPKFLRSSSSCTNIKSKKLNRSNFQNESFDLVSTVSEQDLEKLESNKLFERMNSILEDLIKHFKQTCDESSLSADFNFMETSDQSAQTYLKLTMHAQNVMTKCLDLYRKIELNVDKYDFDPKVKSNGYRSLLRVFESCAQRLFLVLNDLNEKKGKFYFQLKLNNSNLPASFLNSNLIRDFQTWLRLMEKLEILLLTGLEMQLITLKEFEDRLDQGGESVIRLKQFHDGPSLFVHLNRTKENTIESNLFSLASVHQEAFFGRACGFQFCESLQLPLTGCAVALASYNDGFEAYSNKENTIQTTVTNTSPKLKRVSSLNNALTPSMSLSNTIGKAAVSVYNGTKYIMDPDSRAKKMSHIMRKANVEFCKAFWQLTETSIVQMGSNLVTPTLAVNVVKRICISTPLVLPRVNKKDSLNPNDLSQNDFVEINPPKGVLPGETLKIRILSNEMRKGMDDLDKIQLIESPVSFANQTQTNLNSYASSTSANLSKNLILHVHGGGFIAHSSKSHEIYLKPWCKELKVPIVSVDYSLAPEHAFPRASEECFYVYAWCLLNKHLLGWTGERIICVGDSAGGVLVTNIVQRAINSQVRVPDALVPIYAPFLLSYSLSPSRLLSVMDPLLNLGILWRCLAAYSGIDFRIETEKYKIMLNLVETTTNSNRNSKITNEQFSIRYSKSDSFDYSNDEVKIKKEDSLESENSYEQSDIFNIAPMSDDTDKEKVFSKEELLKYYALMGDAIFLIDKLRNHKVTYNQYMSPILSSDTVLSKFPKTCLIACNDPFLDDNIEMYKHLKKLNVNTELLIVDNGSPHGFLNMQSLVDETHEAHEEALNYLRIILNDFDSEKD